MKFRLKNEFMLAFRVRQDLNSLIMERMTQKIRAMYTHTHRYIFLSLFFTRTNAIATRYLHTSHACITVRPKGYRFTLCNVTLDTYKPGADPMERFTTDNGSLTAESHSIRVGNAVCVRRVERVSNGSERDGTWAREGDGTSGNCRR